MTSQPTVEALASELSEMLDHDAYADIDPSANGLQVGPVDQGIERVGLAVDAGLAPIEAAIEWDVDLLCVHHGLIWNGIESVTGPTYRRLQALIESDVALFASHLPLDGHGTLGNAAVLADILEVETTDTFGPSGGLPIGQQVTFDRPRELTAIAETLSEALPHGEDGGVRTLAFGDTAIESAAIVTGSGTDFLERAIDVGADVLITGEGKQAVYHAARDHGMSVILAGHYATEVGGIQAVGDYLSDAGLETRFFDHPTGI